MTTFFLLLAAAVAQAPQCALTTEDKIANARLNFEDFDQKGTTPATARQLSQRGCWRAAVEATEDYLANGPLGTEGQQRVLRFHLGQQLANAGRESEAALVIIGTRNPLEKLTDAETLRWNDFVRGHWAFFTKKRAVLQSSLAEVKKGTGFGNVLNGALLDGLIKCFDRPYLEAVSEPCRTPPPESPK